ncbi:hypothetical protein CANMA_001064 [Candida margitis]|uniref:uncharacterized protein n=1 Tax=Candida margitis TaxID=1775924 RepID=UPI002225DC4D|nr:uncharacterized protein CANMA_001064 [Candida margitis]KAI5969865.1 hypothetical protein CANMA_001064 [Candida margitis]
MIPLDNSFINLFYVEAILSIVFIASIILICLNLKSQSDNRNNHISPEKEKLNSIELSSLQSTDILNVFTNPSCPIVVSFELNHTVTAWIPSSSEKHVLASNIWPVNHISISDDGVYIILICFNKQSIYCYEDFELKWTQTHPSINRDAKVMGSFFRHRTVPGYLARKLLRAKRGSSTSLASEPQSTIIRCPDSPILSTSQPTPFVSPPSPSTQAKSSLKVKREHIPEDFVLVLNNGTVLVASGDDGSLNVQEFEPLSAAAKVKTPRVNDKIICQKSTGEFIIGIVVNNNFVFHDFPIKIFTHGTYAVTTMTPSRKLNTPTIVAIEFIGMIVSVCDFTASLIDVQTGIVLKTFNIGHFKPGTFKVAHSQPTHCKFCGCVSVTSLSLIYEDDSGILIVHTFKIDMQRSKNSICLRAERDPREIRCLGFSAVCESQYWYEDIKCWQVSDVNMIIGFEKVRCQDKTSSIKTNSSSAVFENQGLTSLRQRNTKATVTANESYEGVIISLSDGKKTTYPLHLQSNVHIVSTSKYGFKSILVNFGNCFKIFYQGNNKLIENDLYYSNNNSNSLSFINKRRNLK